MSNQDGVIWIKGMEKNSEKKDDNINNLNIINNSVIRINDNNSTKDEIKIDRNQNDDLNLNINKKEISSNNLLPLNNISNYNNNNSYSNDSYDNINEEEINNNNKFLKEKFFNL